MEKQRKNSCAHVGCQIEKLRRLYSQIGEPLPVDILIDLHRHLGSAMELYEQAPMPLQRPKKKHKSLS